MLTKVTIVMTYEHNFDNILEGGKSVAREINHYNASLKRRTTP